MPRKIEGQFTEQRCQICSWMAIRASFADLEISGPLENLVGQPTKYLLQCLTMKSILACTALLVLTLTSWSQEVKPLDPALTILSKFVGGKWKAEGGMPIVHEWKWNADKRGLHANNVIGLPGGKTMNSTVFLGWDPVAKKVYYLDMHDSEMTYYGHITEKNGGVEFRFGVLGSGKEDWIERGKFVGEDEWQADLIQIKDSKEVVVASFKMKRQREN
jgi:hypothetical protein